MELRHWHDKHQMSTFNKYASVRYHNMRLLKIIHLILTFYKNFFLATSLITIGCIIPSYKFGTETFFAIFWCKIAGLAFVFYFIKTYKSKEFYYYQNLGISKTLLWLSTFTIDFILFILSLVITYKLR